MMAYEQEKWLNFWEQAQTALLHGHPIEYVPTIRLVFEPSFHNHILLQLQIGEKNVSWIRKTWLKLEDRPKFINPIESLKYIGQAIKPTIQLESGEINRDVIQPVMAFFNEITVKPCLEQPGIVIDGALYTLTIGIRNTHVTYKWHYLPEEWSDLQTLADMVLEINQQL